MAVPQICYFVLDHLSADPAIKLVNGTGHQLYTLSRFLKRVRRVSSFPYHPRKFSFKVSWYVFFFRDLDGVLSRSRQVEQGPSDNVPQAVETNDSSGEETKVSQP